MALSLSCHHCGARRKLTSRMDDTDALLDALDETHRKLERRLASPPPPPPPAAPAAEAATTSEWSVLVAHEREKEALVTVELAGPAAGESLSSLSSLQTVNLGPPTVDEAPAVENAQLMQSAVLDTAGLTHPTVREGAGLTQPTTTAELLEEANRKRGSARVLQQAAAQQR
eukprot:840357-Prymnesium_polylepis.1